MSITLSFFSVVRSLCVYLFISLRMSCFLEFHSLCISFVSSLFIYVLLNFCVYFVRSFLRHWFISVGRSLFRLFSVCFIYQVIVFVIS